MLKFVQLNEFMTSIPQKVEEIIERNVIYKDLISKNLINLSELARQIKPEIELKLIKSVSEAAILMALKRYSYKLKYDATENTNYPNNLGDISVRSGLFEITIPNSAETYFRLNAILNKFEKDHSVYITFIRGVFQTTIIAGHTILDEITTTLRDFDSRLINNLSSLTLGLQNNHLQVPGIMAFVLSILSAYKINVIEVVSTADEFTVIVKSSDITKAFEALNQLK